jgi:hypothetical protein
LFSPLHKLLVMPNAAIRTNQFSKQQVMMAAKANPDEIP